MNSLFNENRNTLVALGIWLCLAIFGGLFIAMLDSRAGEVASALGSLAGGAIGALGAAAAVYLTLTVQRRDETAKILLAIAMEVAQLAKFPRDQLDNCISIYTGQFSGCTRAAFPAMMATPMPTVYPALSEKISRHPDIAAVVAFYIGLQETRAAVGVIMSAPDMGPSLKREEVLGIGILLREQCILARRILSVPGLFEGAPALALAVRVELVTTLTIMIARAAFVFPSLSTWEAATRPY